MTSGTFFALYIVDYKIRKIIWGDEKSFLKQHAKNFE